MAEPNTPLSFDIKDILSYLLDPEVDKAVVKLVDAIIALQQALQKHQQHP